MNIKLDQLKYFAVTAQYEHIGTAAKTLRISASAISHAISLLEEELGFKLFSKKGTRIQLTEAGKNTLKKALKLLEDVNALGDTDSALQTLFRLGCTHVVCSQIGSKALVPLALDNPNVEFEMQSLRSADVLAGVLAGNIDLGMCMSPQPHPELAITTVFEGRLSLAVGAHHPLLKLSKKDRLTALSDYPCAMPKALPGIDVCHKHPVLQRYGISKAPQFVFDSYDIAVSILASSEAWSLIPDIIFQQQKMMVVDITPTENWDAGYTIAVVRRAKDSLSSHLNQMFLNEVQKVLG